MNPNSKKSKATEALVDLMQEELLATPDEELDAVMRELGLDPAVAVARVEMAFQSALKAEAAARLARAKEVRNREIERLGTNDTSQDLSHAELYALVRQRSASLQGTLLHRDFSEATEEDLRSILRQLDALQKTNGKG
jgi:hypothetical protein